MNHQSQAAQQVIEYIIIDIFSYKILHAGTWAEFLFYFSNGENIIQYPQFIFLFPQHPPRYLLPLGIPMLTVGITLKSWI